MSLNLKYRFVSKGAHTCVCVSVCADSVTLAQAGYGLQDTLSEGGDGVLNAGSQAERVL